MSSTAARNRDIAIIGMACVFPGAPSLQAYWENIFHKTCAIGEPPATWEADLFLERPEQGPDDRLYNLRGGYLGTLAEFDPTKYGIMPNSVDGTEPDHFLALKAAYEAMADAGYRTRDFDRNRAEVIIGRGTYVNRGNTAVVQHTVAVDGVLRVLKQLHPEHSDEDIAQIRQQLRASLPPFHAETAAGLVPNIISGRVANRLDLMGANYLVDAACASSLVAIDHGMRDLLEGRCDLALVGGVHASTPPPIVMIFCQLNAISRRGEIRPFDSSADGTLLGEGVGMVVLKRREDAERDGDRIYAIVKGVGVSSDGKALGLLAPRREGEELALRRAYENAGVAPETVELVEAHGTATPVGDAVEVDALNNVFGPRTGAVPSCALGSVKSMISHLMPASGIAGLIKTALALHHRVLPPTLNCDNPNPKLGLDKSRFYLNSETRPWIHGSIETPRRAGVNAFGFGGINAHVVLEEYNGNAPKPPRMQQRWDSEVIILSAQSRAGLLEEIDRTLEVIGRIPDLNLKDLGYTLNVCRELRDVRLSVVASSIEDLAAKLSRAKTRLLDSRCQRIRDIEGIYFASAPLARGGKLAVVFPGEGSQYPTMLADLCMHFPEVRSVFDLMDRAFANHPRQYLPSQVMFAPPQHGNKDAEDRIYRMDFGAEAVFTANQALGALLMALGIKADAMVGHSTGEHSAILVSGAVKTSSDDELIEHIRHVNAVFEQLQTRGDIPHGVLVAVGGVDPGVLRDITARSNGSVHIAMDNCPHQTVLCGSSDSMGDVVKELQSHGGICQTLPFARAYHTPWFEVFCEPMREYFERVTLGSTAVQLYSCVTAARYPDDLNSVRQLIATQWARPVRFRETIQAMYDDGVRIFVESGPRANLCGFIDDILRGKPFVAIPANVQHRSGIAQMNHLVAQLAAHAVPMRLPFLYEHRAPVQLNLEQATTAAAAPARRAMPLATGLQPLRLPEGFALPRSNGTTHAEKSVPLSSAEPPRAAVTHTVAASGMPKPHADVLRRHFETMDQFLKMQSEVMGAYLTGASTRVTAKPADLPFVQSIAELVAGERATIVRRIVLEEDRLFAQHTLGRNVSRTDPDLLALPVVPLTITIEMLAEAAAVLRPGKVVGSIANVRALRWITLEKPETELEFLARSAGDGDIDVSVKERRQDGTLSPVIAEAKVVFADSYANLNAAPFALKNGRQSTWKVEQLYHEGMFHGPCFQAVKSVDRYGDDGNISTLEALPSSELLRSNPSPRFLLDPVLLDAAGQALAYWVKEQLGIFVDVFPFSVERIECYGPPPTPGTRYECRVRAELIGNTQTRCDIDIVDERGAVLYAIKGWCDRRFELPEPFVSLRIAAADTIMSTPWATPLAAVSASEKLACYRLDCLPETLLDAHGGIWMKVLAHLVLSRRERDAWYAMKATPKRQHEWLLGRTVAKDAIRRLVERDLGERLPPADVEIMPDQHGRPHVAGAWLRRLKTPPAVSISHSGGVAVALATVESSRFIGLDIESISRRCSGFEKGAFTAGEQQLLASFHPESQLEWALRLWCAKEAVGKALGRGLSQGPKALVVKTAAVESGAVGLTLDDSLLAEFPHLTGRHVETFTARDGDFITSAAVFSPE